MVEQLLVGFLDGEGCEYISVGVRAPSSCSRRDTLLVVLLMLSWSLWLRTSPRVQLLAVSVSVSQGIRRVPALVPSLPALACPCRSSRAFAYLVL